MGQKEIKVQNEVQMHNTNIEFGEFSTVKEIEIDSAAYGNVLLQLHSQSMLFPSFWNLTVESRTGKTYKYRLLWIYNTDIKR
jgi:hypothetical protein